MPSKAKEKELEVAVEAPEPESQSALAEAMLKTLMDQGVSIEALNAAFGQHGLTLAAKGAEIKRDSRKSRAETAMEIAPLDDEQREVVEEFGAAFDHVVKVDPEKGLDRDGIDDLIGALLKIRPAQDLAKGRHDGIREAFFEHFDATGGSMSNGYAASAKHGHKVERVVYPGKVEIDFDALAGVVSEEQLRAISYQSVEADVLVRTLLEGLTPAMRKKVEPLLTDALIASSRGVTVDPELVVKAVDAKVLPPEKLYEVTTTGAPTQKFYVKALKAGDPV